MIYFVIGVIVVLALLLVGFLLGSIAREMDVQAAEERILAAERLLALEGRPMGLMVTFSNAERSWAVLLSPQTDGTPLFDSEAMLHILSHVHRLINRNEPYPLSYRNRPNGISVPKWSAFIANLEERGIIRSYTNDSPDLTPELIALCERAHRCVCGVCDTSPEFVAPPTWGRGVERIAQGVARS